MAMEARQRLARAVAVLGEAYRQTVTATTIRAYELGLAGVGDHAIEAAVAAAIATRRFMPTPVELRELAGEMSPEDRAVKAWFIVREAVLRWDYYDTMAFDDPFAAATIRNLWRTWAGFCEEIERTDEKWLRKDFERVYAALWRAGISPDEARPLLGAHDLANGPRGYALQTPVTVAIGLPAPPRRMIGGGARSADRRAIDGGVLQIAAETLKGI